MTDSPFTNREIKQMFNSLHDKIDTVITHVTKTNGRVTSLEKWQERLKGAGATVKIAWGIISVFLFAMMFAMFKMYVQFQGIDQRIQEVVTTQLNDKYNK